MKTYRILLAALLLACAAINASGAALVGQQTRGILGNAELYSTAHVNDTIGPLDSVVLYVGEEIINREMIVAWDSLKGTGNDSVDFTIRGTAISAAGTVLARMTDTTIAVNTPGEYVLPMGTLIAGDTYRWTIKQGAGAGGQLIFPHIELLTRKAKY
jgi:hypothetical protein